MGLHLSQVDYDGRMTVEDDVNGLIGFRTRAKRCIPFINNVDVLRMSNIFLKMEGIDLA